MTSWILALMIGLGTLTTALASEPKGFAAEQTAEDSSLPAELQWPQGEISAPLRLEFDDLRIKINYLDVKGQHAHSRHVLAAAAERFRAEPEACLEFLRFWCEADKRWADHLTDEAHDHGLTLTTQPADRQALEKLAHRLFDEEFYQRWFGYSILRNVGYATAEWIWMAEWIDRNCSVSGELCTRARVEKGHQIRSGRISLQESMKAWIGCSKKFMEPKLSNQQIERGSTLISYQDKLSRLEADKYHEWFSYNLIAPQVAYASLLAWQGDYCFKEEHKKQENIRKAFEALDCCDPVALKDCNIETKAQYRITVRELEAICKKYPAIQVTIENKLEIHLLTISAF